MLLHFIWSRPEDVVNLKHEISHNSYLLEKDFVGSCCHCKNGNASHILLIEQQREQDFAEGKELRAKPQSKLDEKVYFVYANLFQMTVLV